MPLIVSDDVLIIGNNLSMLTVESDPLRVARTELFQIWPSFIEGQMKPAILADLI